jgi:hypothetical protein
LHSERREGNQPRLPAADGENDPDLATVIIEVVGSNGIEGKLLRLALSVIPIDFGPQDRVLVFLHSLLISLI